MRCPQCGGITLATTQAHGVASAYCDDCAQWWEWVPGRQRVKRFGRAARTGNRWIARVAAGSGADRPVRTGEPAEERVLVWRGRLLQEAEAGEPQPVESGR